MKRFVYVAIIVLLNILSVNAQIVGTKKGDNGLEGFVDASGNWVLKPNYNWASWNDKIGVFGIFSKSDEANAMIDETGKIIYPIGKYKFYYRGFDSNYERTSRFIHIVGTNGKHGVGTMDGKIIIPCKYEDTFTIEYNGQAFTTFTDGKKGLAVNEKIVLPAKYDKIDVWEYFIRAEISDDKGNKTVYVYSHEGKLLAPPGDSFSWTTNKIFFFVGTQDKELYLYEIGKTNNIFRGIFEEVELEDDGFASVKKNGKWGLYGGGRELLPCEYDEQIRFVNDVATVKKDGEVKMIKNPLKDGSQIMIAEGGSGVNNKKKIGGPAVSRYPAPDSDVDKDIPVAKGKAENTFAFIIANENYPDAPVPYSLNDGRMFREYCQKTLGLPEKNINLYEDATFGNIITAVEKMKQVADAYDGEASVILYYAGHGFPDDKQQTAYLLPIDGDASSITTTGYSLAKLYKEIAGLKLKSAVVFLDACFSGAKREDQMLASSRGVAIKVKEEAPQGNMLVFSAAQGDETAHQLEDKHHGLFTYYLLKQLQATGGNVDMGTLTEYVTKQVKRQSVVINNKKQTPTVIPSQALMNNWQTMKLK
ncbi:MAG: caspase family protein [Prevotella sp.]|nr:caspase family protein [Prevotella sp.]